MHCQTPELLKGGSRAGRLHNVDTQRGKDVRCVALCHAVVNPSANLMQPHSTAPYLVRHSQGQLVTSTLLTYDPCFPMPYARQMGRFDGPCLAVQGPVRKSLWRPLTHHNL
ncbi:hypothetical protein RRF57_006957 [Xylaria bambusicola]|uniref:Uncharacterized protein n=1 Tax=Xylaria bambusicola TaxID=326684 RepID=A0AAN7UK52_9PEZI